MTTRRTHLWILLATIVVVAPGCMVSWPLQEPSGDSTMTPARQAEHERLTLIRNRLSEQLAVAERAVASNPAGRSAAKLAAARLIVMVALVRVDRALTELPGADLDETRIGSLQDVLREAAASVRRTRQTVKAADDERAEPDDSIAELQKNEDRSDKKGKPKKRARKGTRGKCAPGDPLCLDDDAEGGEDWDADDESPEEGLISRDGSGRGGDGYGTRRAAAVVGADTRVNINPIVQQRFGALLGCLTPERLQQGGVRLRVTLRLATDGSFREPRLQASKPLEADSKSCISSVLQGMRVADYDGPSQLITIPLWLTNN